jgi:hypothetical protein
MKNILLAHSILTLVLGATILGALEKGTVCKNENITQAARLLILIGSVTIVACLVARRCKSPGGEDGWVIPTLFSVIIAITTIVLYLRIITNLKNCAGSLSDKEQSNYSITLVLIGVCPSVLLFLQAGKKVIGPKA